MDADQFLQDNSDVVFRLGPPTKISHEPYGFQWHLTSPIETTKVYIQTSKDEANPRWIRWSNMLEVVYCDMIKDRCFVEFCIARYLDANKLP
jgi:hypothetical protein